MGCGVVIFKKSLGWDGFFVLFDRDVGRVVIISFFVFFCLF